jgi:ATP-dependent Clp protease ATP-binding subunit ClpA
MSDDVLLWSLLGVLAMALFTALIVAAQRRGLVRSRLHRQMRETLEFDDQAKAVIEKAREVAERYGHHFVAPEHLLLALTEAPPEVSARLPQPVRDPSALRAQLIADLPAATIADAPSDTVPLSLLPTYTARAVTSLRLAIDSAIPEYPRHVTPQDLLLGLLREGKSPAAKALRAQGVTVDVMRRL